MKQRPRSIPSRRRGCSCGVGILPNPHGAYATGRALGYAILHLGSVPSRYWRYHLLCRLHRERCSGGISSRWTVRRGQTLRPDSSIRTPPLSVLENMVLAFPYLLVW
jgi:hypothetical protein